MKYHCTDACFALRELQAVSLDGCTWYSEGDVASFTFSEGKILNASIRGIYETGQVLLELNDLTTVFLNLNEVKEITGMYKSSKATGIIAYRQIPSFSINFGRWYTIGDSCTIQKENGDLIEARIISFKEDGSVLIKDGSDECYVDYTSILEKPLDENNLSSLTFSIGYSDIQNVY